MHNLHPYELIRIATAAKDYALYLLRKT
jgi:hypothetical protein